MTLTGATILLVEDDPGQRRALAGFLRKRGYAVHEAASAAEAEQRARESPIDLLLTDLRLGGPDGISVLEAVRVRQPEAQSVVLTAYGTVADAVRAMRAGAFDFLAKPVDLDQLEIVVERALERVSLSQENRSLRRTIESSGAFAELLGTSSGIAKAKELAAKVAASRVSVLVLGESGTGKEVLARGIHLASPRRDRPLVSVNCAALPESLVESELFGHEKGSFTGATAARKGRFELAHEGTLFLDEVGDIPLPVQVKLLRVLQSGSFERVGGTESHEVDVRVVAATHRDLQSLIKGGRFREDLYYRLNVVSIILPPLRERPEDIPLLAEHFVAKYAALSGRPALTMEPEVFERLSRWRFPGNVRELENWIERAVVLAEGDRLTLADFPAQLSEDPAAADATGEKAGSTTPEPGDGLEEQVARLELSLVRAALERNRGNQSAAARDLKLTERAVRYKIRKYGL